MILKERFKIKTNRYWEVDTLRGVAVILMIFYHLTWDLNYFRVVRLTMTSGPWSWFARFIATMFIPCMCAFVLSSVV